MPRKRKKMQVKGYCKYQLSLRKRLEYIWKDILGDSGWGDEEDFKKMKPTEPVSDGWLFYKDKDKVLDFWKL
jgi:hypothetical protein